jgi:DNA ligase-1
MKKFAALFTQLDQTAKTNTKLDALVEYFDHANDSDKIWAIAILSHRRPKRTVNTNLLRLWAAESAVLPEWLFDECYSVVGDLAETITLVLPEAEGSSDETLTFWIDFIRQLADKEVHEKKEKILWAWNQLSGEERFVFIKLITGSFRIGVSQQLMVRALTRFTNQSEHLLAHKLMGQWSPLTSTFNDLILGEEGNGDHSRPYPFYLAYALDQPVAELGDPSEWFAERKWDGIRGQVIVRHHELFVWSRGEELVTEKYPEYREFLDLLPDGTVIDGEILPFEHGKPLGFQHLQRRIGRKTVSQKLLKEVPVAFVAYDLLEHNGKDIRDKPLEERRMLLESLFTRDAPVMKLSPLVPFHNWDQLTDERLRSREFLSEGIMLKRRSSVYGHGRRRGDWWKWKIDPLTIDAVMVYAMAGHGRRANLYTDYTFAVWDKDQLIPFAKAYSGLTDEEIVDLDRWIRKNTIEKFGPVRSVRQELVFEIGFEGIQRSTRHKSGIALRFPRILRRRQDKPASEANTLSDLRAILESHGG